MDGVLKLVSNHTKTVDLNGMFYQEAKEHILSQWIPNFEPRFPIPGGERPKMGQKWVGVLRLVSHHTKRVDLNGMLNQGAKEHILSQWTQNLGHEFPVPGVIGPNWVKNGSSNYNFFLIIQSEWIWLECLQTPNTNSPLIWKVENLIDLWPKMTFLARRSGEFIW